MSYPDRSRHAPPIAIERSESEGRSKAVIASDQLSTALHKLFRKWEIDNGFKRGAGQLLLPAGWRGM